MGTTRMTALHISVPPWLTRTGTSYRKEDAVNVQLG